MDKVKIEVGKDDTPEWQWLYKTLEYKLMYLHDSKHMSDVTFIVGENAEEILAHKFVLACSSSVFETMFYGSLPEGDKIRLPDDESSAFLLLLKHIYYKIEIESVMQAMQLYTIAHKYRINNIMDNSIECINSSFGVNDVLKVLQFARLYNEETLIKNSLEEWMKNTSHILQSEEFLNIDVALIEELFGMQELKIESETELIEAFGKYVFKHKDNDEFKNYDKQRTLRKIRMLSIEPKDIIKCTVLKSLISESDYCKILENILVNFGDVPEYICKLRRRRGAGLYYFPIKNRILNQVDRLNRSVRVLNGVNGNVTMKVMFFQNSAIAGFYLNYPNKVQNVSIIFKDVGQLEHTLTITQNGLCYAKLNKLYFVEGCNWKAITIKYDYHGVIYDCEASEVSLSEHLILEIDEKYDGVLNSIQYLT